MSKEYGIVLVYRTLGRGLGFIRLPDLEAVEAYKLNLDLVELHTWYVVEILETGQPSPFINPQS